MNDIRKFAALLLSVMIPAALMSACSVTTGEASGPGADTNGTKRAEAPAE